MSTFVLNNSVTKLQSYDFHVNVCQFIVYLERNMLCQQVKVQMMNVVESLVTGFC